MTATTPEATVSTAPRRGAGRGRERAVRATLLACTIVGLAVLTVLLLDVAVAGVPRLDLGFLTSYPSRHPEATGILAGLTGTLSLLVLVVALAVPVGIGAALYLEELAPATTGWSARLARVAEINIANLAGVPSVVFGLLGSTLFVYWLGFGRNLLAGARFPSAPWEPFAPFSALPVQILGFVQRPQPAFREEAAAAAIVVLLVVLLAANAVAVVLRARARRSL